MTNDYVKYLGDSEIVEKIVSNGEVIYSRQNERKKVQAETLARLYEMGELSQQAIDKIKDNRPEVYQMAKDKVTGGS